MRSIRGFLLVRLLTGSALVLAAAGAAVYVVAARSLEEQFDRNLSDRVQAFASILFQVEDEVDFAFSDELMPEYEPGEAAEYFQLTYADGRVLERSNSLGDAPLDVTWLPPGPPELPRHGSAPLPDGRPGRYVAQRIEIHHVYPEEGPDRPQALRVDVVVARGTAPLVAAERRVLLACAAASLALMALLAGSTWLAVRQGLAPARRLAAELDEIEVERLPARFAERFDDERLPAELRPVVRTTDALIRRVDAALERERRSTADIAHELRTPLSEVLTTSEVALRNGMDLEQARGALVVAREAAWRMGRSVSTLLKLARIEMGAERFGNEPLDAGVLVGEARRSLEGLARERAIAFETRVDPGDEIAGDAGVVTIVVTNLLTNAVCYAPRGTTVRCALTREDADWTLAVDNAAPELEPGDLRSLSEPFWRKDRARADRDRSGLGLALSRALAEAAGMTLEFELADGRFRASLRGNGSRASA